MILKLTILCLFEQLSVPASLNYVVNLKLKEPCKKGKYEI